MNIFKRCKENERQILILKAELLTLRNEIQSKKDEKRLKTFKKLIGKKVVVRVGHSFFNTWDSFGELISVYIDGCFFKIIIKDKLEFQTFEYKSADLITIAKYKL